MKKILLFLPLFILSACSGEADSGIDPHSEDELSGLTLSTTAGSYYQTKYEQRGDVKLFLTNSETDAVQAVRQGFSDVYVGDEVMLTTADQQRLGMRLAFCGDEYFDVAFAIRKGNSELVSRLNEFIASAPLDSITEYWIHGGPEATEPPYVIKPDAKPLRCICGVNLAPVCFIGAGGEWQGIDADVLRRFAHSQGRPFEMNFQEVSAAVIAIQTGQADVFSSFLFITDERKKSMDFTIPYYQCHPGYFVADAGNSARMSHRERWKMNLLAENRWRLVTDGLVETIIITVFSILLGTILGAGVCACRRSRSKWLKKSADVYSDFINGIPTLVLLLIMFYVVLASSGLSATVVAIITFALCFASSSGNIFDSAISSVPVGQTEAGLSLGFTPLKTFTGIVFPQALQKGLPLYIGECVSLLKSTSIVGYIAIADLTRASDLIRSRTFDALIPLLIVTILYFLLAWLIRKGLSLLVAKRQ